MIYLFFIELYEALSSTEKLSCLRCRVRAAQRHKGTPELEMVRKKIFLSCQTVQDFFFVVAALNQRKKLHL